MDALLERLAVYHTPVIETPSEPKHWFWIIDELGPDPQKLILISEIQKAVAAFYNLTQHDLVSERRTRREVLPRHVAMYLCHILTRRSHEMIARWFNRCDHSVSIFACKKIARLIKTDADLAADVTDLQKALA